MFWRKKQEVVEEAPEQEPECDYSKLESDDFLSEFNDDEKCAFHLGMDYQFARTSLILWVNSIPSHTNGVEVYAANSKRIEGLMTALGLHFEVVAPEKYKHKIRYQIVTGGVS